MRSILVAFGLALGLAACDGREDAPPDAAAGDAAASPAAPD